MNNRLLKRDEVAQELTWRLEDIYPNEELLRGILRTARRDFMMRFAYTMNAS